MHSTSYIVNEVRSTNDGVRINALRPLAEALLKDKGETPTRKYAVSNEEDEIRTWVRSQSHAAIVDFLINIDSKTEAGKLAETIDAIIVLSADKRYEPCGVNHYMVKIILDACEKKHSLMKTCAQRIAHFLQQKTLSAEIKNVIAEVINRLNWFSLSEHPEYNFAELLANELPPQQLLDALKGCFSIYHMTREKDPYWDGCLRANDVEISRKLGLTTRAYSPHWYYLESEGRLIGVVMAAYAHSANEASLFMYIFEQRDTSHNIGTKIIRWAVKGIINRRRRGVVSLFYPAARPYAGLFLRCQELGIVHRVEAIASNTDTMCYALSKNSGWTNIRSVNDTEKINQPGKNLFIRAIVEPEAKAFDSILDAINAAA